MDDVSFGYLETTSNSFLQESIFVDLFFFLIVLAVLIVVVQSIRYALQKKMKKTQTFRREVLQIKMPKEAQEQAEKEESNVNQKKDIKEVIAVSETLYSNLAGAEYAKDWNWWKVRFGEFWSGVHGHISMEMVVKKGVTQFFVSTPHYLTEYVEQQILSVYPTAQVEIVDDYNIFEPTSKIVGTYLTLTQNPVLPIRTYKNLDSDPLDGITNTLSKLVLGEGAAIQILLRAAKPKWRAKAWSIAKSMHDGKSFHEAVRSGTGWVWYIFSLPLKILEFIASQMFSQSKMKEEDLEKKRDKEQGKTFQKEEEIIKLIEENSKKAWFEVTVRLISSADSKQKAQILLRNMVASFSQFREHRISNGFKQTLVFSQSRLIDGFIYRHFSELHKFVLSSEELSSIYHFPLPSSEAPNIDWLTTRRAAPPTNLPQDGIILGKSVYRGREMLVRMKRSDRRRHVYFIGKSGMGKSVLLEKMASQDIQNGEGVCVIDPHGDLVNHLLTYIPPERIDDVIYFDPGDTERPMGLNMLEANSVEEMDFATQEMIAIFYQLVSDPAMIGPMFEHSMRNAMFTLMANTEYPGTIADIPRIFTDTEFQKYSLKFVTDPIVRAYWEQEMAKTSDFHKSEMLGYIISKVGRFVENSLMRNIIGQPHSGFDFNDVMNKQKILLVNLSKGKVGEINSNLLGLIIVSKLQLAALRRANLPEGERKDFYLYIDEFQNYITDSIATILSEARKYRLNLIIAHQYMGQLLKANKDTKIRDAVLGNAGTMLSFKIGMEDAEVIAKEFAPTVNAYDLVNAEKFHAYIKLLVDNQATRAFTMETMLPQRGSRKLAEKIKELSRLKYGKDRSIIEAEILERTKLGQATKAAHNQVAETSL